MTESLPFSLGPLLLISAVVLIDLLLRLWIFGRLESVAIDVCVFSLVYCIIEGGRAFESTERFSSEAAVWAIKTLCLLLLLAVMAVYHNFANKRLYDAVRLLLDLRADSLVTADDRKTFRNSVPVLMRSVVVTFVGPEFPFRKGKANWREEVVQFVNKFVNSAEQDPDIEKKDAPAPLPDLNANDLLLERGVRWGGLFLFAVSGTLSYVVAAWQYGT